MAITLFGHPMSTCTRKVLTVLAEKGVHYHFELVDLMTGQHKSVEHLERQPFGQVPVLDHDGFKLYESRAICCYLDEVMPGVALTPHEAQGRALMRQWMSVEQSNFSPTIMKIIYQLVFNKWGGKPADAKVVEEGRVGTARALDVLEGQLAKTPNLVGAQFTLADIGYMPYLEYLSTTDSWDLVTSRPSVSAWWQRNSARPSWQKAIGK